MKKLYLLSIIALVLYTCKAPEVGILKPRPCPDIKATLITQRAFENISEYYFNCDSLTGTIKEITWKVNNEIVQVLPRNRSFSYVFQNDGNYSVSVEVKDSCDQVLTLKKELNINTAVYVRQITRFVNNDGTDADIQGMAFDNNGGFKAYIVWNNRSNFYPGSSFLFKDCETPLNGSNGNIGNIRNYRFSNSQNKAYVIEVRNGKCELGGGRYADFILRSSNSLQTHNLSGRESFELGTNNIFTRGSSNVVVIPYAMLNQNFDPVSISDTIKYNFNTWGLKFAKFSDNEYLAIAENTNLAKYTFVKFKESDRSAVKLFDVPSLQNSIDGKLGDTNVGVGTILDVCTDDQGNVWILESNKAISQVSGIPGTEISVKKIGTDGQVKTIVNDTTPHIANGLLGLSYVVEFNNPKSIAFNPIDKSIYFSDGGRYKRIIVK